MISKGHDEGHPRPPAGCSDAPADEDHPRDLTRDIPGDDFSIQILRSSTKSKTVNSLEGDPR